MEFTGGCSALFRDRVDAGRRLAEMLAGHYGSQGVVLGLPRGGVVIAYEIAAALGWPLEVIITHKIPAPGSPEYAIGAVAETGQVQWNESEIRHLRVGENYLRTAVDAQLSEIGRRRRLYRDDRPLPEMRGSEVVVADDGVATGYTMKVALQAVRAQGPRRLIAALPVGPLDTVAELRELADEVVVLATPQPFYAVGMFYHEFDQTGDAEVLRLLDQARRRMRPDAAGTLPEPKVD